tara:strand:- start:1672 stop:1857 length:186 start_codon:yes stop_codon:yes gene_type:complete
MINNKTSNKELKQRNHRARGLYHRNEDWIQTETDEERPPSYLLLYAYKHGTEDQDIGDDDD